MHERKFPGSGAFQPPPHLVAESCGRSAAAAASRARSLAAWPSSFVTAMRSLSTASRAAACASLVASASSSASAAT